MGSTALRQLLASLCFDSVWNYAVLWKFRPGNPMFLTWEDGYFNFPKLEAGGSISDDARCFPLQFETNASHGTSEEDPVLLVVADMMHLQYVYGDGAVGGVAAVGDYRWVSLSNIFSGDGKSIPECPEEWLLQFVSGIKTILLVPVLPDGVLQFGSLEEIAEDISMVTQVTGRFNCLHSIDENTTPSSLKKEFPTQLLSLLSSTSTEYLNAPSTSAFVSVKTEDLDYIRVADFVELDNCNLATETLVQQILTVQDVLMPAGNLLEGFKSQTEGKSDVFLGNISSLSASATVSQQDMMDSKLFELSCLMEELQACSGELGAYTGCGGYNGRVLGESFNGTVDSYPAPHAAEEPYANNHDFHACNRSVSSLLEFPEDSELRKALEPLFEKQMNGKLWESTFLADNICRASSADKDPCIKTNPSWLGRGNDAEYLLEAVVAKACSSSSDGPTLNKSNNFKSCTSFSGQTSVSPMSKKEIKANALLSDNSDPQSHLTYVCVTVDKDVDGNSGDTVKTKMSTNFSKHHKERGSVNPDLRKGHKILNSNKKGARAGDNKRPRPRDRQLIQDRVKELRELVPNAAKCSIDSLLDQTVKHMMYLRSVTSQAEKLRQCVHQELAGCKNWRPLEIKQVGYQNGTSWALEYGNEFLECPITVEDLAYPGHMLIEMLCNEHGLFLEIAQVIRGLDLTILKGVLESRAKNTWARFVVEAPKGFHRLDIFWPLMQLLQRKRKSIASKI